MKSLFAYALEIIAGFCLICEAPIYAGLLLTLAGTIHLICGIYEDFLHNKTTELTQTIETTMEDDDDPGGYTDFD